MNQPQTPEDAASMIERITAQRLPPKSPPPPQAGNEQSTPPPPQAGNSTPSAPPTQGEFKQKDTAEGNLATAGAPQTEAGAMSNDAIVYDVPIGEGRTRKMTPQQVASVLDRYSSLNYKHSTLKPVVDVIENYLKANPDKNPEALAKELSILAQANQSNPTMGNTQQPSQSQPNPPASDDDFSKWEENNAAQLPPGYRDMFQNMNSVMKALQQQNEMLQRLVGGATGVTEAARQAHQGAQSQRMSAVQTQIGNNLDRAQSQLQLPDDSANDFMIYATERGYTMEDFIDPDLTVKVMTDFRNTLASPEMDRLRQIAQRRQAFTGSVGSTPSAGAPAQTQPESTLDRLTSMAMAKKSGG